MRKLLNLLQKDNSKVLIGNLLASFFGLLNFMLMVRIMDKNNFGQIVIFLSVAGLADLIKTGFVRQGLVRHWLTEMNQNKLPLIGSAWFLHIAIAALIALICSGLSLANSVLSFEVAGAQLFFEYYPLLLLVSIPHQMESWIAQAKKQYSKMNLFRLLVNLIFFSILAIGYNIERATEEVILYLITSHALVSIASIVYSGSIKELIHTNLNQVTSLFHFGKYSLSTLAGSNLLKSTDILLIGMMMSSEAAAIYAIPLKVIELLEIPLRGFVMTSFNTLTRAVQQYNKDQFAFVFQKNAALLTLAFVPFALICLFAPGFVIEILGGVKIEQSVYVLQVLAFAMILLPVDKFAGMALDSINKPNINAAKVWIMVIVNLIGDLIVIYLDGPLWMISLITVLNISSGVCYGLWKNSFLKIPQNQHITSELYS